MNKDLLKQWKKVTTDDLGHVCYELEGIIEAPALIIFEGELGAGKTTFCKEFLKDEGVFSPSYSILTETRSALHADFYRLEPNEELTHLEIPMYLEDKSFFLVEWGLKYANKLYQEVPEEFECYLMEIEINEKEDSLTQKEDFSRNFFFHLLTFD